MPHHVQLKLYELEEGIGPTLNEEYNVGSPHTSRNNHNNLIFVPNGDSGDVYEFRKGYHRRKHTFEARSRTRSKRGPSRLRPMEKGEKTGLKALFSKIGVWWGAYKLGNHGKLGKMVYQIAGRMTRGLIWHIPDS
jgi:hypothetical protein